MRLFISPEEHQRRVASARGEAGRRDQEALVLFGPAQIFYLTGFAFIATERPAALVVAGDSTALFIPCLEEEHAASFAVVDRVVVYPEYPGDRHPMMHLSDLLAELGLLRARIGVDGDGYPGVMGYRGPRLSEALPDALITPMRDLVEGMMTVKSAEEIALIRESVRWGNLAHRLLQDYTRAGVVESEASQRASHEATSAMARTLGPAYRPLSWTFPGAHAGYRGQVGRQSAVPHAMTTHARIRPGDVLVTGASAAVGGYSSELERTMVVTPVGDDERRFFNLMLGAQQVAFDAIRPGRPCYEVDRSVRVYMEKNGLTQFWRHHTGHALGIGIHEAPFLDTGDETVLLPGMVLSVEPGIYVPGFAGFRHSDTVLVTEDGVEILTYYPRDLESLTIPG